MDNAKKEILKICTLINILPTPLLRRLGSRTEYITLIALPLRAMKFRSFSALEAVTNQVYYEKHFNTKLTLKSFNFERRKSLNLLIVIALNQSAIPISNQSSKHEQYQNLEQLFV